MSRSVVFSASCALGVLASAALLDLAKPVSGIEVAARADRADLSGTAGCGSTSLIAACANASDAGQRRVASASAIQVFEREGETILVRIKMAD